MFALQIRSGMGRRVHLLQRSYGDVRVPFGCPQADVAEHLLDEADVRAALQHQRRHRVAEEMGRAGLPDLRLADIPVHHAADVSERKALPGVGEEDGVIVRLGDEFWTGLLDVLQHPCRGPFADGNHAVLAPFALADEHRPAVEVHVVELESGDLHAPHSRSVQDLHERPVA